MLDDQSLKRTGTFEATQKAVVSSPSMVRMALPATVRAALALAGAAACGGGSGGTAAPACDPCVDGAAPTAQVSGHETNPDGVPYPSPAGGYGRNSRMGTTPGSIMQNYRFLGYPNSDTSKGLQTVALADYYDPCNKRYKLLHVTVAGLWCTPCNEETAALVAAAAQITAQGAVIFQVLDDGPIMGVPATPSNLTYWTTVHKTTFTEALDPMLVNLGPLVDAASIPWNCDIDPRTMEILDQSNGWAMDVTSELAPGFQALPAMPSYPSPVACN